MTDIEKILPSDVAALEAQAKQDVELGKDAAHNRLITDLEMILAKAKNGEFHDFHPNGHATPKMWLASGLEVIKQRVIEGIYDN